MVLHILQPIGSLWKPWLRQLVLQADVGGHLERQTRPHLSCALETVGWPTSTYRGGKPKATYYSVTIASTPGHAAALYVAIVRK